jgi:hypothetical protein
MPQMTKRIGPKMVDAAEVVNRYPGCTKKEVAKIVGPNQSLRYGYQIVDRAIGAGLIHARACGNHYQLFPGDWDMSTVCF